MNIPAGEMVFGVLVNKYQNKNPKLIFLPSANILPSYRSSFKNNLYIRYINS